MKNDPDKYTLKLSHNQLIHMRRFLIRGLACATGTCHPKIECGWYYVDPLLRKIAKCLDGSNK